MGNAAAKEGAGAADVDLHWRSFPRSTKQLFEKHRELLHSTSTFASSTNDHQRTEHTMFSSPKNVRDGLDLVINFVVLASELFLEDDAYNWDLCNALKSAYILAADALVGRRLGEATLLHFYSAFLEECLSRGFAAATGCWIVHRRRDSQGVDVAIVRLQDSILFSDLAHLYMASVSSRSTGGMAKFLACKLGNYSGVKRWLQRLEQTSSQSKGSAAIHSFEVVDAVPDRLVTITCKLANSESVTMNVYGDSKMDWIVRRCLASSQGATGTKLFNDTRRLSSKRYPCLRLWNLDSELVLNMASSGEKTLSELGVKDRDAFLLLHDNLPKAPIQEASTKRAGAPLTSLSKIACCSVRP